MVNPGLGWNPNFWGLKMLNRIYNVVTIAAVIYLLMDLVLWAPLLQRKWDLLGVLLVIAFRYIVRLPSLPAAGHSRCERL
jgi:hypothetical protein